MSASGSSLRFTVEVAADQATQALQAVSVAANQAGVDMRTSLLGIRPAAQSAGKEIQGLSGALKDYASEQRQQARVGGFFVRELAEIVPVSGAAKAALGGLAGALVGGFGIGMAIDLVLTGVKLLASAWREESAAEEKARKATAEHARAMRDLQAATDDYLASARGATGSQQWATGEFRKLDDESRPDRARLDEIEKQMAIDEWQGAATSNDLLREREEILKRLAGIEERRASVRSGFQARTIQDEATETAKAQAEVDKKTQDAAKKSAEQKRKDDLDANRRADQAVLARLREQDEEAQALAEGMALVERQRAGREKKAKDERDKLRKQELAEIESQYVQPMVQSFVGGLAKMAQGQASFADVMKGIWQDIVNLIVRKIMEMATKQIMASAAVAGAEGAKSQAGIPVVGPLLAAGAMAAMMALVQGALGSLPSAQGGWWNTGSYEGLAMIHKNEMVADAPLAEKIRSGGIGGPSFTIVSPDARGVERLLTDNQGAVARALRKMQRSGRG